MSRVAAVDCGTNTVRLLVADLDPATGTQRTLRRESRIVRLGQDVDRTGRLAGDALGRVFATLEEYADLAAADGVSAVRVVATSAVRDAANAEVFLTGVRSRLGVLPDVLDGDEEARLTFAGATRGPGDVPLPVVVLDVGGGSTEVVLGPAAGRSLDIGSVRLTERLLRHDPPHGDEVEAARRAVDEALDTLPSYGVEVGDAATVIGVAGTAATIGTLLLGLPRWDADRVVGPRFTAESVHRLTVRLLGLTTARREELGVPAGRADVVAAGCLVVDRLLRRCPEADLVVSESDLLDGVAWTLA